MGSNFDPDIYTYMKKSTDMRTMGLMVECVYLRTILMYVHILWNDNVICIIIFQTYNYKSHFRSKKVFWINIIYLYLCV